MTEPVVLRFYKDGPIQVTGDAQIDFGDGGPHGPTPDGNVFLCRCGTSKTKPYCDGSHMRAGFTDTK